MIIEHQQVENIVWDRIHTLVYLESLSPVSSPVRDQVRAKVFDQVWDQVSSQVYRQVRYQVYNQVSSNSALLAVARRVML